MHTKDALTLIILVPGRAANSATMSSYEGYKFCMQKVRLSTLMILVPGRPANSAIPSTYAPRCPPNAPPPGSPSASHALNHITEAKCKVGPSQQVESPRLTGAGTRRTRSTGTGRTHLDQVCPPPALFKRFLKSSNKRLIGLLD